MQAQFFDRTDQGDLFAIYTEAAGGCHFHRIARCHRAIKSPCVRGRSKHNELLSIQARSQIFRFFLGFQIARF